MSTSTAGPAPRVHQATIPAGPDTCDTARLRCASLLKPLYAWAAAPPDLTAGPWLGLMRASVTLSDNDATDTLVGHAGGPPVLLAELTAGTGVSWEPAATWGRVITANEVATAYQALREDPTMAAQTVRAAMRAVQPAQRLGAGVQWSHLTGADPGDLAVKAGWDLSPGEPFARTHVVVMERNGGGAVVLTAVPVTDSERRQWLRDLGAGGPAAVLGLHERWAGTLIRDALARLALVLR